QLLALRACARRVQALELEAAELEQVITNLVQTLAPSLLKQPGVGPITAAQLLITWSHPNRIHSEAAFARLAGVAPIPASSGKTTPPPRPPRRHPNPHPPPPQTPPHPPPQRPRHHRLHQPPPPRRKNQPRSHPLPQALPRPRPLPPTPNPPTHHLTSIEASSA